MLIRPVTLIKGYSKYFLIITLNFLIIKDCNLNRFTIRVSSPIEKLLLTFNYND